MKITVLFILVVFMNTALMSQHYMEDQTVQVIVHKVIVPETGSMKEALALTQDWTESVLRKNENIDDVQLLMSDTSKDTVDLMVIYKFKKGIVRSTNEINQELIKARWSTTVEFEEFLTKLHWYINPKLNEKSIYKELTLR